MFQTYFESARAMADAGVKAADPLTLAMPQARALQDAYFAHFNLDLPPIAQALDLRIPGPVGDIGLRLYRPTAGTSLPVIVFVRGAGWWAGSLDSHARTMIQLAIFSGCAVLGVDYRRTPEHRFPIQRDELLTTLRWLREQGAEHELRDPGSPVIFGESAGATLCLSAAMALRDRDEPAPAGLVLFYTNAGGPKPTARAYSQWVWQQYLGHEGTSDDASAVPLLGEMHGLPPVWLGAGEDDPLITDTLELEARLSAAGVPHELVRYPGLPHGFVMWSGSLAPALDALQTASQAAAGFLRA
ncbi:alpha/beta hydrolase [Variovorax sp. J22R115]|uniref:alpha/beta hydrolase n=1 Tax=Variovorax sp. J22R115 TaxID=3053509 RepID=UPI00257618A3|nr:alpha/beta hydrolase [Variovorax sp. J22R115]MDM0053589.1 alpha/beta hydrolase [Variovorax sp. J22R115]